MSANQRNKHESDEFFAGWDCPTCGEPVSTYMSLCPKCSPPDERALAFAEAVRSACAADAERFLWNQPKVSSLVAASCGDSIRSLDLHAILKGVKR